MSVIARYRRLGKESLQQLKNAVTEFAEVNTYKETARKLGVHHSPDHCFPLDTKELPQLPLSTSVVVPDTLSSEGLKPMSVIARYRRLGKESLQQLKNAVTEFAEVNTYKETARKFGIHHSTVSVWVKESNEKRGKMADAAAQDEKVSSGGGDRYHRHYIHHHLHDRLGSNSNKKISADDIFISWLSQMRKEDDSPLNAILVRNKARQCVKVSPQELSDKGAPSWLHRWLKRREDGEISQNLCYPPAFKLEVALYARRFSQYAASKTFGVARRRIFDWMRQIPKLRDLIERGHLKRTTGRGPKNRQVDVELYEWFCGQRDAGKKPKSCQVQEKVCN